LLEINARPGLTIQIANQEGIIPCWEVIDRALLTLSSIQDKIGFAQDMFAVRRRLRSKGINYIHSA
jgi:hypothetical protein